MMIKNKTENNMSSSCLTRRSRNKDLRADWMPDQVGHDRKEEQGRSMVEMLGVLAVVGVLSVGGIAGYTYAMNKHYANELLAGASERAVLVAAQLVAGKTPNLNEFANHTVPNGTFGEVKTDIEDGFGITVSGVKEAVCENLIKATEGTDIAIAKDDERLSDVTCSGDSNAFMFVFDYGVGGGAGDDTKPTTCPTGTTTEGAGGYATTLADNSMCYCETAGTVYKDGTCETKEDDTCSSYADCDKGEYCQFNPSEDCETDPTSGVCQSVSGCGLYDIDIGDGKKYTASDYSDCSPDWWTAQDVCASLNMHMVSLSDVGCEDYKDKTCPTEGTVYGALKTKGLRYSFWTTDMYDSCSAWYVDHVNADFVSVDACFIYGDFLCVR